jgi:hypothetical protein
VLGMCMKLGGANFGVMKMLSEGHARRWVCVGFADLWHLSLAVFSTLEHTGLRCVL